MLRVTSNEERRSLGYTTDTPVIAVSHQLKLPDIQELLKQAYTLYGEDIFANCPEHTTKESARGRFLCSVEGARAPNFEHSSLPDAMKEAKRLAAHMRKPVKVLRMVSEVHVRTPEVEVYVVPCKD